MLRSEWVGIQQITSLTWYFGLNIAWVNFTVVTHSPNCMTMHINEAWTKIDKPGIYRGQCAELCGRAHGFMPIVVQAVEEDEYDQTEHDDIYSFLLLADDDSSDKNGNEARRW